MENQEKTVAQSIVEKLSDKVSQVAVKYSTLQGENETLNQTVASKNDEIKALQDEIALKNQEIAELQEQNEMKELEMEDIVSRVESILG